MKSCMEYLAPLTKHTVRGLYLLVTTSTNEKFHPRVTIQKVIVRGPESFSRDKTPQLVTFSLGTLLMVLSGRSTRSTLRDLMVLRFFPALSLHTGHSGNPLSSLTFDLFTLSHSPCLHLRSRHGQP